MLESRQLFGQIGAGREGLWEPKVWKAVLEVLAKHDGESYSPASNPVLFEEVQAAIDAAGGRTQAAGRDENRSIFRAAPGAWSHTGTVIFSREGLHLTDAGQAVIRGEQTYRERLTRMFATFRHEGNQKNPFKPILELLADGMAHEFDEIFDALQHEVGTPMRQWLATSKVPSFPYVVQPNPNNPSRSVHFLLQLLSYAEIAHESGPGTWQAKDLTALGRILEIIHQVVEHEAADEIVADGGVYTEELETSLIVTEISRRGWQFAPWQVSAFCQAIKTKPFVILAGISGTGKSKLPRLVAQATDAEFRLIPVRADWRDSSDLIGFTDLAGQFQPGHLLRAAREAMARPEKMFFVLLDEMNLARVEYYFAEVLSLLEERQPGDQGRLTTPVLAPHAGGGSDSATLGGMPWSSVYLPANLAIVGSVNMDETTHPFSRKVLDRAFVLEFSDVDLALVDTGSGGAVECVLPLTSDSWKPTAVRLADHPSADSELAQRVIDELVTLNGILSLRQLQVGYRLRDEVILFVLNLVMDAQMLDSTGGDVDSVDLALCMKVLPRIQGGGGTTSEMLKLLEEWAGPRETPRLPMCSDRIDLMRKRFDSEGFTNFWL